MSLPQRPQTVRAEVLEETCTKIRDKVFCMVDMEAYATNDEKLKNHIIKLENQPVWEK